MCLPLSFCSIIYMLIKLQREMFFVFMHYSKFETCLVCLDYERYFKKMVTLYLLFSHSVVLFLFVWYFIFQQVLNYLKLLKYYISHVLLSFRIRKIKWWWCAIPTISTKRATTSHHLCICFGIVQNIIWTTGYPRNIFVLSTFKDFIKRNKSPSRLSFVSCAHFNRCR